MVELRVSECAQGSMYLFVIRNRNVALLIYCKAVWLSIPFRLNRDILVCVYSQYSAIRDIDYVEVSRRSVNRSFEKYVLKRPRETATPFRFTVLASRSRISVVRATTGKLTKGTSVSPVSERRAMRLSWVEVDRNSYCDRAMHTGQDLSIVKGRVHL